MQHNSFSHRSALMPGSPRSTRRDSLSPSRRSAFTLVEILVTTMVMLIMVLAMSQMFALMGRHVSDGRALIELQGQLRASAFRVQEDLNGLTLLARTSPELDWELGYFEYIEGVDADPTAAPNTIGSDLNTFFITTAGMAAIPPTDGTHSAYGDIDDVLMFTARSTGRPFVGRIRRSILTGNVAHNGQTVSIESHDAEIIYWTQWVDADGNGEINLGEVTLHRRVLLIRPDLTVGNMPTFSTLRAGDLQAFYNQSDLSVHPEMITSGMTSFVRLRPNSLADLSRRENRVAHLPASNLTPVSANFPLIQHFPNYFSRAWLPQHFDDDPVTPGSAGIGFSGTRAGEDIVQSDLLAFDVRAYDPSAVLRQRGASGSPTGDLLTPGDWGWSTAANNVGAGAFVDIGYAQQDDNVAAASRLSLFSVLPQRKSGLYRLRASSSDPTTLQASSAIPTYDTWTWAYEHDGLNQANGRVFSSGTADEATDGLDNDNANGVDDVGERETSPPYPFPLRGLQVTLRVIELDTRQVRQTSVVADFVPE